MVADYNSKMKEIEQELNKKEHPDVKTESVNVELKVNQSVRTNDIPSENKGAAQAESFLTKLGQSRTNEVKKPTVEKEKTLIPKVIDKMKKPVMVVKRDLLLGQDHFDGFRAAGDLDYSSRVSNHFEFMERGLAEEDADYKQPIGYVMLVNPQLKQVFVYQRAKKDKDYTEKRLQGKYSWGVGGHIDEDDSYEASKDPIHTSLMREIEEEIGLEKSHINNIKVLGYINDEGDAVGKVHFGILYLAETDVQNIEPKGEMMSGKFMSIEEMESILSQPEVNVESWSKIAFDPIKKLFS